MCVCSCQKFGVVLNLRMLGECTYSRSQIILDVSVPSIAVQNSTEGIDFILNSFKRRLIG